MLIAASTLVIVASCGSGGLDESPPNVETKRGALTGRNAAIYPFGSAAFDAAGNANICLGAVNGGVTIGGGGGPCTYFAFSGTNGSTATTTISPSPGLCLDILYGDLSRGTLDVTTCNGSVNQQWLVSGGQIVSANTSDGRYHCMDVLDGVHSSGTPIDVAPCNGTQAQSFWIAGSLTMSIPGAFVDRWSGLAECMDVRNDNENVNAPLDNSDCYNTNAQVFTFDGFGHITLATNQFLCLVPGTPNNGVAPLVLDRCTDSGIPTHLWTLLNRGFDGSLGPTTSIQNNGTLGCIDVLFGVGRSGQSLDVSTCNGTSAQEWRPMLGGN
jgi:hypothetical protein